ncbi:hypothetical protein F4678DRAFT_422541 [Xylaria arbuscula]|nr:hypothetical protein F4678DRAFT_422541 [Xylaria arbuscula]
MPSATQSAYSMVSPAARKRRRDDGEVQKPFNSTLETSQNIFSATHNNERFVIPSNRGSPSLYSVPRKAIPLPVSKKFRLIDDNPREQQPNNHSLAHYHHHHDILPSTASHSQPSHFSHAHPELASAAASSTTLHHTRPTPARTNSSALLSPCHICHRKPTKKSDLDSFADCMGCGERTCFVCIRACQGWLPALPATSEEDLSTSFTMRDIDDEESSANHATKLPDAQNPEQRQKKGEGGWSGEGHRGVICSRCCVERGPEGDVVCLGCLAGMRGA